MEEEDKKSKEQISRVLKVLEALKQASHELQTHPPKSNSSESNSPAVKALLELENESDAILSTDPNLSSLCHHLSELKSLVNSLRNSRSNLSLRDFLSRRVSSFSLSKVAGEIESEIQAWIDRESIENLSKALVGSTVENEEEVLSMLVRLEKRVGEGFDRELQDLVLKAKIFTSLERVLCDPSCSKRLREHCALVIAGLIRFNKDVFVGQVLMGPLIHALVSIGSRKSLKVLCSLIMSIRSPFVDEIESNGEIPKIISFLDCKDLDLRVLAMDCILEIGYYGRKEAIEAMFKEGLIKKLVELQRSELGGDLFEMEEEKEGKGISRRSKKERKFLEEHPFASIVARFGVQLEVGEGLRQRERRAFKQEILERVREACVSDADAATIVAEVLWGSSP